MERSGVLERLFVWMLAAVLIVQGVLLFTTARQESQTWDEAMHLAAGYGYWRIGDFAFNPQHPPLVKLLAALPLRFLDVNLPPRADIGDIEYARGFLYENKTPWRRMLGLARVPTMLFALGLTAAVAWWTRRRFGAAAALLVTPLVAFEPNLLAHGRYVTTDVPMVFWFFLTVALWLDAAESGSWRKLGLAGLSLGGALATKFSAVILLPLLPVLYWVVRPRHARLWPWLRSLLVVMALGAAFTWTCYLPWLRPAESRRLDEIPLSETPVGQALRWAGSRLHARVHPYWVGLDMVAEHNRSGHVSYLMGQIYEGGDWRYFPAAFLVKTPLAVLLLAAAAALGVRWAGWSRTQSALLLVVGAYFAFCASSRMNLGLRHLLPMVPPLWVLVSSVLAPLLRRRAVLALVVLLLAGYGVELARIHPYYLAFFNVAAGGPAAGPKYLLDSNIDWGQDLDRLMRFLQANGISRVYFCYFGSASWAEYPVDIQPAPATSEPWKTETFDGVVAASVTPLFGLYVPPAEYAWLRARPPTHRIGYSIWLWDMRRKP